MNVNDFETVLEKPERPRGLIIGGIVGGGLLLCLCIAAIVLFSMGQGGFLGAGDSLDTTGGGTVGVGESVAGEIADSTQAHDWFFDGVEGQFVIINIYGDGESDPRARLITPGGKVLARDDDSGEGFDVYLSATLPADGTYTVRVDMFGGGTYTLTLD
jgi:hypothetical protein